MSTKQYQQHQHELKQAQQTPLDLSKDTGLKNLLNSKLSETTMLKITSKPLLYCDIDDNIRVAYDLISNQKVLSIPVFSKKEDQWVSMLDVRDMNNHLVSLFDSKNNIIEMVPEDFTVRHLLTKNDSLIRECPIVDKDCTILDLVKTFKDNSHRVCVSTGQDPKNINIISELSLIKWIDRNRSKLGNIGDYTLEELGVLRKDKKVISIPNTKLAIDAFRKLSENKIYGMPIVSETDDELVDNISVIDIKNSKLDLNKLKQPLSEYFVAPVGVDPQPTQRIPIICTPKNKFREVIGKISSDKVHRLFIVQGLVGGRMKNKPISIISVSDIVKILYQIAVLGHIDENDL